jgi:sec-independent protein translocase protein TatC
MRPHQSPRPQHLPPARTMSGEKEELAEGTLISHLLELRTRLMKAFIAVIVVFIPCAIYANELFEALERPLQKELPPGSSLIATSITSTFTTPFKLAFIIALIVAMPVVLYQIWSFVAPGLYKKEKRFAKPLLVSAIVLFYCGVAFAYWIVFPIMFQFFVNTTPKGVLMMTDIQQYVDFVLVMALSFGVAFEVPVAVVLLITTGMVSIEKVTSVRGYVLIGIFVIAAILTPPDAVSQTIMALPMYALYEGGIIFARILMKTKKTEQKQEDAA